MSTYKQKLIDACKDGEIAFCKEIERQVFFTCDARFMPCLEAMWNMLRMSQIDKWHGEADEIYYQIQCFLLTNALDYTNQDILDIRGE